MPILFDLDSPSNVAHHRRQVEDGDFVAGFDVDLSAKDKTTILVHLESAVVETAEKTKRFVDLNDTILHT
jgi:hypothetical protein